MLGIGAVAMLEADRRTGTPSDRSAACDHVGLPYLRSHDCSDKVTDELVQSVCSATVDGSTSGRVPTSGLSEGDEDDERKRNDRPPTRRSWRSMLCFTW